MGCITQKKEGSFGIAETRMVIFSYFVPQGKHDIPSDFSFLLVCLRAEHSYLHSCEN